MYWTGTLTQKLAIALAAFFVTVGGILVVVTITVHLLYGGQILPGVTAYSMALGGRTQAEAEVLLNQAATYPEYGRVVLKVGENLLWAGCLIRFLRLLRVILSPLC
jgi:pantothenate kinase type III